MQFIQAEKAEGVIEAVGRLKNELALGHKVLWLVSGGSNISTAREIMASIPTKHTDRLTIMLNDERFGQIGHVASNWHNLFYEDLDKKIPLFDPKNAKLIPTLRPHLNIHETTRNFEDNLRHELESNDVAISLLGMGADGHTSGILPNSKAAEADDLAVWYRGADDYLRITNTFKALREVDCAYLFAYGADKRQALENLRDRKLPLEEQPAQILWEVPKVYVYNDQLGDQP
jgi:6-phosphogluconolactonase/glucosamine-6-phosphate isomerase/deaminase